SNYRFVTKSPPGTASAQSLRHGRPSWVSYGLNHQRFACRAWHLALGPRVTLCTSLDTSRGRQRVALVDYDTPEHVNAAAKLGPTFAESCNDCVCAQLSI